MSTASAERAAFRSANPVRHAVLDGVRWEYWAAGSGPRGLLVLGGLHSFGDCAHRLVATFCSSRRVVAPSYPMVDSSDALIDALPRLLDAEGLSSVDVFGQGLGAGFAHVLARRHPGRVRRLSLSGFGLTGPARSAALRAKVELLCRAPWPQVRAHCLKPYERLAHENRDGRATEILAVAQELLHRHSRESALCHLRLQADLARPAAAPVSFSTAAVRTLLVFANDDPRFTRQEQNALEATYCDCTVTRHLNAGRSFTLSTAWDLERKLEVFFRPEELPRAVAATTAAEAFG